MLIESLNQTRIIMIAPEPFIDLHCHLLPGLDDGPRCWEDAVGMAKIAAADGIGAVVATPHQLGNHPHNTPAVIREHTAQMQRLLLQQNIAIELFPGGDVRIEPDLVGKIQADEVMTLADLGRHVLLELPHEIYIPLDGLLHEFRCAGLVCILSHPERNLGILNQPKVLRRLHDQGCLFQITAGSLAGKFGLPIQKFSEWMIKQNLVHIVSTDAHGPRSRMPVLSRAFQLVVQWIGQNAALDLFCRNPAAIIAKSPVTLKTLKIPLSPIETRAA
jgi:protein-tyrosine phosphatase